MARNFLAACCMLLAVACVDAPPIRQSGTDTRTITWVRVDAAQAHVECEKAAGRVIRNERWEGCAFWVGTQCTILAPAPSYEGDRYRMWILGHEMLHCFEGHFHAHD